MKHTTNRQKCLSKQLYQLFQHKINDLMKPRSLQAKRRSLNQFDKCDYFCWYLKCNEDTRWGLNESVFRGADSIGYLREMSRKAMDIYKNMIKWDNACVYKYFINLSAFWLMNIPGKLICFVESAERCAKYVASSSWRVSCNKSIL